MSVRGSAFSNRRPRRQRNRGVQKATFKATITTTLSNRAILRNRRRNNRQNRRTEPLTQTECTASLTLNPQETDFDEVKFKMDMGVALDEMEQDDEAFYQQFDAKLSFDCQQEDDEGFDVQKDTGTHEPAQMNADSSSRNTTNPASSNGNHTNASGTEAQGSQSHDANLVNGYGSTHLPTESNTKLHVYDENDDIETYEDFLGNDWYATEIDEVKFAFYD